MLRDSLPWKRSELRGWGVSFYASQDASEGPQVFCASDGDTSVAALTAAVQQCPRETAPRSAGANRGALSAAATA